MRPLNRLRRLAGGMRLSRRGSVLLLALGVLGILAIAALSYVTTVRLDRQSAAASSRRSSYQVQVDAVVTHMQDLLAADLFGNKIVTRDIPPTQWPAMFEDAEWTDVPAVDPNTFAVPELGPQPRGAELGVQRPSAGLPTIAHPDDAWLAATEPHWERSSLNSTRYWPQITNLRSGYRYDARGTTDPSDDRWVRGDGRFADLGSWFLAATPDGYANPSISLLDWDEPAVRQLGPQSGSYVIDRTRVDVYDKQMGELATSTAYPTPGGPPSPSDERQWADTDGDLRPDARWTELDSLGNLFGLNWVVAARIIDASALINVNSAVDGGYLGLPFGPGVVDLAKFAAGDSPADIDLARLLNRPSSVATPYLKEVSVERLFASDISYRNHVLDDLQAGLIISDMIALNPLYYSGLQPLIDWRPGTPADRLQRLAFWDLFGQSPAQPYTTRRAGYPVRDLVDLAAYWGTNNAGIVSRIERAFDGSESTGFLPGLDAGDPAADKYGPLRSSENPADIRVYADPGDPINRRIPTPEQIQRSARRFITPVSGTGMLGPVPALNRSQAGGRYAIEKPPLTTELRLPSVTADTFASLVWALAPLAANQPLSWSLEENSSFGLADLNYHYGGGADGPAQTFFPGGNADFAVMTAAALTVNLIDSADNDNTPTVIGFVRNTVPPTPIPPVVQGGRVLTTALPQGDIAPAMGAEFSTSDPHLFVGLERQPFLREAWTMIVYSDSTIDGGNQSRTIEAPSEIIGSVFAVELINPWPDDIDVFGYEVVLPADRAADIDAASGTFIARLPSHVIPAGQSASFVWKGPGPLGVGAGSAAWNDVNARITADPILSGAVPITDIDPDSSIPDVPPFQDHCESPQATDGFPVLLVRRGSGNAPLVVDRLSPPVSGVNEFPSSVATNPFTFTDNGSLGDDGLTLSDAYYTTAGYDVLDPLVIAARGANEITGRYTVVSNLSRPSAPAIGSLPKSLIERAETNVVDVSYRAQAWLTDTVNIPPGGALDITSAGDVVVGPFPSRIPGISVSRFGTSTKIADESAAAVYPKFEFVVAGGSLDSPADVLQTAAYAHTNRNNQPNDLSSWTTMGEWLGRSLAYNFTLAPSSNPPDQNPYLGVLDPSRYIINVMGAPQVEIPDTMAMPLALRVPECFEDARALGPLVQGRININTAPREVLETLPLMSPPQAIGSGSVVGGVVQGSLSQDNSSASPPQSRVGIVETYRDPSDRGHGGAYANMNTVGLNALPLGLRAPRPGRLADEPAETGFATVAELAALGNWGAPGQPAPAQTGTFLELGADALGADTAPFVLTRNTPLVHASAADNFSAVDGAEERAALYRAVSNIASVRSDVFIAWFIIRGYDPQAIERITISPSPADAVVNNTMDDPNNALAPAYESRWLVVFDRSQTQSGAPLSSPTDRPRILMKVELPAVGR
ncbi:MAG: hypothetical protein SFZ24_01900 [Planctomycetota bacterium]|nr:hypothetical protein [Planctomycetota bacterium]